MQTNKTMKLSIFVDAEILNISWCNISIYISLHSHSGGKRVDADGVSRKPKENVCDFLNNWKKRAKNDERDILILRRN